MRNVIIIFSLLFIAKSSSGQVKVQHIPKSTNPFEMVHVGDTVRNKLYQFLSDKTENAMKAGISIYQILGEDKANNYHFVEGIYSFKLMGPHFPWYYFIYTKKDGVQVIKNYDIEGLLTELIVSFRRNEATFSEQRKIAYLKVIIKDVSSRNHLDGDSEALRKRTKPK